MAESGLGESPVVRLEPSRAFAALANRDFRIYFFSASAAMMADNIEHVISYWVIFQKFHDPALAGIAVISHWVPYLLFAAYSGAFADHFDIRRLMQLGMLLFIGVSVSWGLMFMTDTVVLWKVRALLLIHGCAGVLWIPASQVLLHQIVRGPALPSAVRINATGRYLGFLIGPAVGAGLLLCLGPAYGIFFNALIYTPLLLWLVRAPYGPRTPGWQPPPRALRGFSDIFATIRVVAASPVLLSMTGLIGASSFFIGSAYSAQMPEFATDLGHGRADFSYSLLLAADAAGGLFAGLLLESRSMMQPKARSAISLAVIWSLVLLGFALCRSYWIVVALLFIAGFVELAFNAMAQTLVQLHAPAAIRGSVIGVFTMSSLGLRAFSGVGVGLLGASIGIHRSLALCAIALLLVYAALLLFKRALTA